MGSAYQGLWEDKPLAIVQIVPSASPGGMWPLAFRKFYKFLLLFLISMQFNLLFVFMWFHYFLSLL